MKNIAEAQRALTKKPLRAVSAERFLILNEIKSEYKDLPQPLRFSKMLSVLLERVSVPVLEYDLIAGRIVDRELTEAEEAAFEAFKRHPDYPAKGFFLNSGHCTYSWELLAQKGLLGLKEMVEDALCGQNAVALCGQQGAEDVPSKGPDREQRIFLQGMIGVYEALQNYMLRYARAAQDKGLEGWPEDFLMVMRDLAEKEGASMEDFYEGFLGRMADYIDRKFAHAVRELEVRSRRPAAVLNYGDCFTEDSVRKGQTFGVCARYHFELCSFQMFGTVADCFITVDELVYRRRLLSLKQLLLAVDENFEGHARILAMCRSVKKYGSDTELSNYHAKRLSEAFCSLVMKKTGLIWKAGSFSWRPACRAIPGI